MIRHTSCVDRAKSRVILFWLCILCQVCNLHSQSYLETYKGLIKEKGFHNGRLTDSLVHLAVKDKEYKKAASIAHFYSLKLYAERKYDSAIQYATKEVQLWEKGEIGDENYVNSLYNLALFYRRNSQFQLSIENYLKVINLNKDAIQTAGSYGGIGINYFLQGKYSEAIEYLKKSTNSLEHLKAYRYLYSRLISLTNVYLRLEDPESLRNGLKIADKINMLREYMEFSDQLEMSLNTIYANFYGLLGGEYFDLSREYYLKNIEITKRTQNDFELGRAYSSLSYLYNSARKDSAYYYATEAIKLVDSDLSMLTTAYVNYIEFLIINKDFQRAIIEANNILEISAQRVGGENKFDNLDLRDLPHKRRVLLVLKAKSRSQIGLGQRLKNSTYLDHALSSIKSFTKVVDILDRNSNNEQNKLFWSKQASQAYLYGAYASHLLGDSSRAFSFMEKNKALLLSEGVLKNTEFANLPRHISQQEIRFQQKIYELENKLSKDEENAVLQDSLFLAKRSHAKYIDSLKTVYPKYFARKINVDQIPLSEVQKELGNNEAVLSYIWNDFDRDTELIIGLVATNNHASTFEIKNTEKLREQMNLYKKLISKPLATKEEQRLFQKVAHELYSILLPNQEVRDLIAEKNLTIIPDGDLQNIPFESLITKRNSYNYLISNGDINYSYSYSFLKHNEKVNRKTKQAFIGYSPSNFSELSLSNLLNSKEEVLNINEQFDGIVKLQDTATKEDFLSNSSDAKIIHLATHADIGKNPWIAFSDQKLELHELYTYKNNADLVTLSACNTSLGELAKGEGVLSLARGFFYSGSKSVVSSLWSVNDQSTSEIMTNFYANIGAGQTKSEALNNAKRSYLTNHTLSELSPYYWSSFILIGDSGSIDLTSNSYLYFFLGLFGVALVLFFRKKIKKSG